MDKKVEDIVDAFENYRFEDALRQIDQLMKKVSKDTKKKSTLTENDNRMINIIKCGSLASIGKIHEANQILETCFTDKALSEMPDKQKFLFCSIAELANDENILKRIQILNKTNKSQVHLERFMMPRRLFQAISKTFWKQFVTQKKEEDGLAQIYLEYVNELNKFRPVEQYYARNLKIEPNKELNLKMIELFFNKYLTGINLSKLSNLKLKHSIIDLKIRLAIHSNKIDDAKKTYLQNVNDIQQNFVYLRSIRDCADNQGQNLRFYIENCGVIFRRNLQIQKYVPLYDFYNEFLDFVLSEKVTKDFNGLQQSLNKEEQLKYPELYEFKGIGNDQILVYYYRSLRQQLRFLTSGQHYQSAKQSDYYKISIKGLMLQLLRIHWEVANRTLSPEQKSKQLLQNISFNKLLQDYFLHFSKTLTYANQMIDYFEFLQPRFAQILESFVSGKDKPSLPEVFSKKDDNLILLTNTVKILVILNKSKLLDWTEAERWTKICWDCYRQFIQQVEQSKRREKGEVFLSDEFIMILADVVVFHIQNTQNIGSIQTQSFIESVLIKLCAVLDYSTENSPFNGYLKLRLLYVCQKLNHVDKLIDTYLSLDIKSVQFQTLGYFFINPMNNFNLYSQNQNTLVRMVRSYQQNQRQTAQYCLKALKAGSTNQLFQYFSYQKRLEKSFGKMLLFYTLYLKNQKSQKSQFYLDWILKKLVESKQNNKKVSFNCDVKTMDNLIEVLDPKNGQNVQIARYNEYFGLLNSQKVFELEIKLRKVETLLKWSIQIKSLQIEANTSALISQCQQIYVNLSKTVDLNELYQIQAQYNLIDQYLGTRKTMSNNDTHKKSQTLSVYKIKQDLLFFMKIVEFKIAFFKSLQGALSLTKLSENNENLINEVKQKQINVFQNIEQNLKHFTEKMLWRQQVKNCWKLREALFTASNILKGLDEEVSKNKKIPKPVKNFVSSYLSELEKAALTNSTGLKFAQNLKIQVNALSTDIDKKYLQTVHQRDEMMRRTSIMDLKQAKNYLLK